MKQIIWTLQAGISLNWKKKLNRLCVDFHHFPTVQFQKVVHPELMIKDKLANVKGVLLTSRIGAEYFTQIYQNIDINGTIRIFTIGDAAKIELENAGIEAVKISDQRIELHDNKFFKEFQNSGFELIHFCSEITPLGNWQILEKRGIAVKMVPLYRPITHVQPDLISTLKCEIQSMIIFGSPSGIDGFMDHFDSESEGYALLLKHEIAGLGNSTAGRLEKAGIMNTLIPARPNVQALMESIFNSNFIMEEMNEFTG